MSPRTLIALAAAVLLLAGCDDGSEDGGGSGSGPGKVKRDPQCGRNPDNYQRCDFEIGLYCQYGAVSRAQLEGCEANVTWGQFRYSDTNAARFARLELDKCLADAGPFCHASAAEPDYDYYGE